MEHAICNEKAGIENLPNSQPQGTSGSSSNSDESETIIVIREDENSKRKSDTSGTSKVYEKKVDSMAAESDAISVVDVRSNCNTYTGSDELLNAVKDCRICQLSSEHPSTTSSLIQLGCGCKGELGISHLHCAEAWFRSKGNRLCEICGETAKNVTIIEDTGVVVGMNRMRLIASTRNSSESEISWWRRHRFSEFLLGCLVLAFIVPWLFSQHF